MKIVFCGDSWASKGYTPANAGRSGYDHLPTDCRLADYWPVEYSLVLSLGQGNLAVLDSLLKQKVDPDTPIIWVYTEPGRDWGRLNNKQDYEWILQDNFFDIRPELDCTILKTIRAQLPNPIALVGGLSDINKQAADLGFTVLAPSWQQWTADCVGTGSIQGWGAADIVWRTHVNDVPPCPSIAAAAVEQLQHWDHWISPGYFYREHPTPKSNKEFAEHLKPKVINWLTTL